MLEECRYGTWLNTLETIIDKMTLRIAELKGKSINKTGVVPIMASKMKDRWENCVNFLVVETNNNTLIYKVTRPIFGNNTRRITHVVDVLKKNVLVVNGKIMKHLALTHVLIIDYMQNIRYLMYWQITLALIILMVITRNYLLQTSTRFLWSY
jgi:hypothetical protein